MKTEALELANELDALHQYVPSEASAMIRRIVEELDEKNYRILELTKRYKALTWNDKQSKPVGVYDGKSLHIYTPQTKPLSDEQIINIWLPFATYGIKGKIEFARAIEERHGIK